MATAASNDTQSPADVNGIHGTKLRRVSGVFVFAGTDVTCDLPVKLSTVASMNFTLLGAEAIAPTSTEVANVVGLYWQRPSTGLMNITRATGTDRTSTGGTLVFYEMWGW